MKTGIPENDSPGRFCINVSKIFLLRYDDYYLLLLLLLLLSLLNLFFTGVREAQGGEAVRCVLPTQGAGPVRPLRQVGRRARTRLTLSDQRLRTTCCNNYYIEL